MNVLGLLSSHDCSFCVLENGIPTMHAELERYIREKEPTGDAFKFFQSVYKANIDIGAVTVCHGFLKEMVNDYPEGLLVLKNYIKNRGIKMHVIGHHQSHAANAFYSSNFDEALVITLDVGGLDKNLNGAVIPTSFTVWEGSGTKLTKKIVMNSDFLNIGFAWQRVTKLVFGLSSGHPKGNQAGTVMAMACMGNPDKYLDEFQKYEFYNNSYKYDEYSDELSKQIEMFKKEHDPTFPGCFDFVKMREIASRSEQDAFDVAAALQKATENKVKEVFDQLVNQTDKKYLCLSGGVVLNSVMTGKLYDWYGDKFEDIYVCPVSYDAGLSIGSAQYLWHHVLDNPRIKWEDNATPYMGEIYDLKRVQSAIKEREAFSRSTTDEEVLDLLAEQNIISVFRGPSESGRRALGNRSILADPRSPKMKDLINEKVKHRQWFRPFAPSILRERVADWFEKDICSPYMSFVINFKDEVKEKVPAVVHYDGTARLQTVTKKDNEWYYNFLSNWEKKTDVPILLNTSFNDREPIVETPEHAINCFLKTDIDYLYFVDQKLLVFKNNGE